MMGVKLRFIFSVSVVLFGFLIYKALEIPNAPIEGWVEDGFEDLRTAYRDIFSKKLEKGSSFAAYYRGKLVAHLWAGCKNFFCTEMWQENTTSLIHSTTKFLGALCLAVMVDRGHLNYSAKVAHYWPEFAANGKGEITVDQLLAHRAGLVGIEPPLTIDELASEEQLVSQRLAEQATEWHPGTQVHYHALTIGLYMNELFKRIDPERRSCPSFLENEVFSPLKLDMKIGLKDASQKERFAEPHALSHLRLLFHPFFANEEGPQQVLKAFFVFPNSTYRKIMSPIANTILGHDFFRSSYLSLPLLSANGISTSISLAQLMGLVALGGQSTKHSAFPYQLIKSPYVMEQLLEPLADISWMSALNDASFGRGFTIMKSPVGTKMIGSPGMGGQMGFADPVKKVGWAYLTNHMSSYNCGDDPRHLHLQKALYSIIERFEKKEKLR